MKNDGILGFIDNAMFCVMACILIPIVWLLKGVMYLYAKIVGDR